MRKSTDITSGRIEREARIVRIMIEIFCQAHHKPGSGLCTECQELLTYANERLARCPFAPDKPACVKCPVHCYKADMRELIRLVMRFSGPRMIWHHPILAVQHLLDEILNQPKPRN